jgi:DNA polymerase III delta prime subunit
MIVNGYDKIWMEKYRPKDLNSYICLDSFKDKIRNVIDNDLHVILESAEAGSGKTSLAFVIANEITNHNSSDILFLNASMDSGIDTIRDTVHTFVTRKSHGARIKVAIMDEVDQMSEKASDSLKSELERFAGKVIFLFTCNRYERLSGPLKDRCVRIDFRNDVFGQTQDERKELAMKIFHFASSILDNENIQYEKKVLIELIKNNFKSVFNFRNFIKTLQLLSFEGQINSSSLDNHEHAYEEIFKLLRDRNLKEIRQFVANHSKRWLEIVEFMYENIDVYFNNSDYENVVVVLSEYMKYIEKTYNIEITFSAMLFELLDFIKKD